MKHAWIKWVSALLLCIALLAGAFVPWEKPSPRAVMLNTGFNMSF